MTTLSALLIVIVSTLIGSGGAFFFKKATFDAKGLNMFLNASFFWGVILYLLSSVGIVLVLKYVDYGIVFPLTALTYVWTQIIAFKWGGEKVTKTQITGVVCILCGVVCLASVM